MKCSWIALSGVACLLPGVLVSAGLAQKSASPAKADWSRGWIAGAHLRLADIRLPRPTAPYYFFNAGSSLAAMPDFTPGRLGYLPTPQFIAVRPLVTADNWNAGSGNWSLATNWTAGVPTSASAVTIGNTSGITVTEDLLAASAASLVINNSNILYIAAGNTLTVGGTTTVGSGSELLVGNSGGGGSVLNSGGSLTNSGYMQIGNFGMGSASAVNVTGSYTGTGGTVLLQGGNTSGATTLLKVSGAAPGTLTGTYEAEGNIGSAAVQWGSGSITQIGDGASSPGLVYLSNPNGYLEIGATNSDSALKGLTTIASNGELQMNYGASLTTTTALTVNGDGQLYVSNSGAGGDVLTLGGSFTNTGYTQIGTFGMGSASAVNVTGSYTGTGGTVLLQGGNTSTATALLKMSGAAPGTLTGTYQVEGNVAAAAVEWGSGGITQIGDGVSSSGLVYLSNPNAYLEVGATNSESALKGLTTIASNGELEMDYGASLTTTVPLTLAPNGQLYVGNSGAGGDILSVGGALSNSGYTQIGTFGMGSASTVNVAGSYTGTGGTVLLQGGNASGATALLNVSGAAPSTLTGAYQVEGNVAAAAVEWSSGGITQIGNGSSASGYVYLSNPNAYLEVGATNSESALKGLTTIASNGLLEMDYGASLTTTVPLTVAANGQLYVGNAGTGGDILTLGGALTNSGYTQIGTYGMGSASTVDVTGAYTGTGGTVLLQGGNVTGANGLLDVSGAAPGTLTGNYQVEGNVGSAAVEWGSGGITQIGDGVSSLGYVYLSNPNAYLEVGATNTESALKGLKTIASNGLLEMDYGASLTTTVPLTIASNGQLYVGNSGSGGDILSVGGALTNSGYIQVGTFGMGSASTVNVAGAYTGTGGTVLVQGGNATGANGLLNVSGATPGTLTGNYQIEGNVASAAVEWGSGGITQIGNGSNESGDVYLSNPNAYLEVGATNSNSALKTLTTIASNGELQLAYGATVATTGALTADQGGQLYVDSGGPGGSSLSVGGTFTNDTVVQVGNGNATAASTFNAEKTISNSSTGTIEVAGGNAGAANAVLEVTGPTVVNSGAIDLYGNVGDAELEINGNVTLSGAGKVTLSNIATNVITGASTSDTLTNSSTIQGSGTIDNIGVVNKGTILANQSTPILILPSSLGLNNQGTLSVLTGDTMQIGTAAGGALTNLSGTTLTGGTYSVGGTMKFGASGASIVTDAANISLTGAGAQLINFGNTSLLTNLATITSAGSLTLGASWGTFTTTGNFTNDGTLSVGSGDKFIVDLSDSLTNFSGTTLTGGTYKITGTLEFAGANIVTNDANITLTGAGSKIDGKNAANGLANFAVNDGSFTLGKGRSFTTAGNFTNSGLLTVGAGDTFDVNGNLTNFSGTTLTGGNYNVSGILQFNGADIVTNAATITLGSAAAKIQNQSAANAMLGFKTNTAAGKFTLSGDANLTTTGGAFTNAGTVTVSTGSTFTVGGSSGNYTQTAGTTTVDGTLAGTGSAALDLTGGKLYGTGSLDDAVTDAATVTPGNSATSTGKLQVNGTYAQSAGGALDVTLGGTTAGTTYDQLNVSSTASLGGTLNVTLAAGYKPAVGNTFDILNALTISGNFTTINLPTLSGEHFTVTMVGTDELELTVVSGAAPASSVSLTALRHAGVTNGRYGREVFFGRGPLARIATAPAAPVMVPGVVQGSLGLKAWRPRDDAGSPAPAMGAGEAVVPGSLGMSGVSALAYNSMAAMNHMRFECGVDVGALVKTGRKRLLRGLVGGA